MKRNFLGFVLLLAAISSNAQVQFLKSVNYRGAFAPSPTEMWTNGWANWDPNSTVYPSTDVTISGNITSNTKWTKNHTYLLQGLVYVTNGATLTIEAGTVVRGDATIANTSLVVTRGAKLYAVGTANAPIVFTSNKAAGSRNPGDWGGIILLGKAPINVKGTKKASTVPGADSVTIADGTNYIEGIVENDNTLYGGTDANDNSGTLKYVRCEFGGYVFQPNKEINGITFGGVGRGTTIDYVQSSYANDDAFEWFGGTVNCSHLISYRGVDDEFDTDNGFSGTVQFCLGVRDPQIGDLTWNVSGGSTSEGFESDNDANGSANTPLTSAIFSNVTFVGPLRGHNTTAYAYNPDNLYPAFRRVARIRRNSRLRVINCIMTDYPTGLFVDDNGTVPTTQAASNGSMVFANNIIAGVLPGHVLEWGGFANQYDLTKIQTWVDKSKYSSAYTWFAANNNDSVATTTDILTTPYSYTSPDYRPKAGSIAVSGADFTNSLIAPYVIAEATNKNLVKKVDYRGAFAPAPTAMWTTGWANWDPNNTVYPATDVNVSGNITSNTTWTKNHTYKLQGLVYVTNGATLTIEAGTVIRGDATIANTSLVITRGAKLNAVGTVLNPIVFTSNKAVGQRNPGDWGGIILLGQAPINVKGTKKASTVPGADSVTIADGTNYIEGIVENDNTLYGGTDANDNSGTLKYVRCEYGGYVFQPNKEINGITFGGVGRGTTIDYVQSSYANDDAFEWFGGTVNCSHLISYRGVDDEFDTDNGYSGTCQFLLGVRDPQIGDLTWNVSGGSTSEGFESDNDANGSANTPLTSALFTNVTFVGPLRGNNTTAYAYNPDNLYPAFRRSARIRRNSRLRVLNCVMMDYPTGLFVDDNGTVPTTQAASDGSMRFSNNLMAGNLPGHVLEWGGFANQYDLTKIQTWVDKTKYASAYAWFAACNNDSLVSTTGVLTRPYDYTNPDYRPATTSQALVNYNFTDTVFNGLLSTTTYDLFVATGNSSVVSSDITYNDVSLNGGTLTINSGVTLTVNGNLYLNAGSIINNGTIVYGNGLTVNSGNTVNLSGSFSNDIINNGTINLTANTTFSGGLTNNGIITGAGTYLTAKKLTLAGTSVNLAGNGSIGVLEINTTGTISNTGSDSLKVVNKLILTKGTLASNGKLTIKSTSLDSTAIVDVVANGSVSGNVVAERFIPAGFRAYRDLTPGVNTNGGTIFTNWQEGGNKTAGYGVFITGAAGTAGTADATSGCDYTGGGAASAYTYRSSTWNTYSKAANYTKSGALANLDYHYGYRVLVRGDRGYNIAQAGLSPYFMVNKTTIRATGTLVTGNVTYSPVTHLNTALNSFSMIGNPYLCPINWDDIYNDAANATANLTSTYYFITRNDSTNHDGPTGALSFYGTYDALFGSVADGMISIIQPGQAIFVQNNGLAATGSLTIKESHKLPSQSRKQYGIFGASASNKLYISLLKNTDLGYQTADAIKVVETNSLAANRGVNKFVNATDNLSIIEGNKDYAIAGYKKLTVADTINLSVDQLTAGTSYQLKVNAISFKAEGLTPYLLDKTNNTTTELKGDNTKVTFVATNADAKRFAIVFGSKAAPLALAKVSVYPNPLVGNTLHLSTGNLAAGKYSVVVYNVLGGKVFTSQINGATGIQSLKVGSLSAGNYNVVVSNNSKVVYSTVLQVK